MDAQRVVPRLPPEGRAGLDAGEPQALAADRIPLLLADLAGSHLAFRTARASRGASLQGGDLNATLRPRPEAYRGLIYASSAAGGESLLRASY